MIKDDKKKKIFSDSVFLTIGSFVFKAQALIIMPVIIRYVGVDNYGIYIQATINASLIAPIVTFSLGAAIWRYTSKFQDWEKDMDQLSTDYWTVMQFSIITGAVATTLLFSLSPVINNYILHGDKQTLRSLQVASLLVFSNALWEQDIKFMQAFRETKLFTVLNNARQLISSVMLATVVVVYKDIFWGIAAFTFVQLSMGLYVFIHNAVRLKFKIISVPRLKQFIRFSFPLIPASIAGGISGKIDRYFIGYFYGAYEIGVYNIIYSVAGLLDDLSTPFRRYNSVYLPAMWDEGARDKAKKHIRESLLLYLVLTVGLLIPMVFLTRPGLQLVLNKDFSAVKNFDMLVLITGLGIIGEGSNRFFWNILNLMEKNRFQLYFTISGAALNIILCFFMVPSMGIFGAGLATFLTYGFLSFLCNKNFSLDVDREYILKLNKLALILIVVLSISYLISHSSYLTIALNFLVVVIVYGLLVHFFNIISAKKLLKKFGF